MISSLLPESNILNYGNISLFAFVFYPYDDWCCSCALVHGKFSTMCLHNVDISKIEAKL